MVKDKDNVRLVTAKVAAIVPSPDNCRVIRETDPAFVELVESVKASGVLIPVHIRWHPSRHEIGGMTPALELLAGERRWRAAKAAGLETIPAIDHGELDDEAAFQITFTENYQRQDLTPLEEGKAAAVLLEKHQGDARAAAAVLGRSEKWVRMRAAIHANLSKKWRTVLDDPEEELGWMSAAHLAPIARLPQVIQDRLLEEHILYDDMAAADLEERIDRWLGLLAECPWDAADETLVPAAGSCANCTKRSGREPGLFHDDDLPAEQIRQSEQCLDPACFQQKRVAYLQQRAAELRAEHPKLVWAEFKKHEWHERRELEEASGESILTTSYYQPARKEAAGAVPAMQVDGKEAGKLRWIRLAAGLGTTRAKTSKNTTETPAKPLKERRAELDAKRWAQVLIDLRERVEEAELADLAKQESFSLTATVPSLAAVFGVKTHFGLTAERRWKDYDELAAEESVAVMARLWEKVRSELSDTLAYYGAVTRTPAKLVLGAGRIGRLIGVDVKELFDLVAQRKGFTEPKSWAGLKADGTPKTRPDKKKTTTKKEEKATTESTEKKKKPRSTPIKNKKKGGHK